MKINERKIGRFELTQLAIQETPADFWRLIFGDIIVLQSTQDPMTASMRYVALCEQFSEAHDLQNPPLYEPTFNREEGRIVWRHIRGENTPKPA